MEGGGPRKEGRGETETMELGKGKTAGTGELPPPTPNPISPPQLPMAAAAAAAAVESLEAGGGGGGGVTPRTTNVLMRQTSIGSANAASKTNNTNCLCSPTTHAGSFRCRLHRATPSSSLQRTKSMDSSDSVTATAPPNS